MIPLRNWHDVDLYAADAPAIWRAMAGLPTQGQALRELGMERRRRMQQLDRDRSEKQKLRRHKGIYG